MDLVGYCMGNKSPVALHIRLQ